MQGCSCKFYMQENLEMPQKILLKQNMLSQADFLEQSSCLRLKWPQEDPMEVALRLLSYNHSAQVAEREQQQQALALLLPSIALLPLRLSLDAIGEVCPVCFDQLPGRRGLFLPCGHFGCQGLSDPGSRHLRLLPAPSCHGKAAIASSKWPAST